MPPVDDVGPMAARQTELDRPVVLAEPARRQQLGESIGSESESHRSVEDATYSRRGQSCGTKNCSDWCSDRASDVVILMRARRPCHPDASDSERRTCFWCVRDQKQVLRCFAAIRMTNASTPRESPSTDRRALLARRADTSRQARSRQARAGRSRTSSRRSRSRRKAGTTASASTPRHRRPRSQSQSPTRRMP